MRRLAGVEAHAPMPNVLRASVGLDTSSDDTDRFADAL